MSDMTAVIAPKSDQINADDLIAGDITITITGVNVSPGQEQPVSMQFAGSPKVFRPCKSMCRVMVAAWGPDAKAYVGKSLTLYRDPKVKWGGMEVGGIRIRAMSHIERDLTMMLSESKANRKPFRVAMLQVQASKPADMPPLSAGDALRLAEAAANLGTDHFRAWFNSAEGKDCRATKALTPDEMARLKVVCSRADNPPDEADPFGLPPLDRTSTATDGELTDAMQREAEEAARQHAEEQARLAGAA
jgi:hypothetical protein